MNFAGSLTKHIGASGSDFVEKSVRNQEVQRPIDDRRPRMAPFFAQLREKFVRFDGSTGLSDELQNVSAQRGQFDLSCDARRCDRTDDGANLTVGDSLNAPMRGNVDHSVAAPCRFHFLPRRDRNSPRFIR